MINLTFSRAYFNCAAILFRIVLDASYTFVISKVFVYEGYILNFETLNYIISWVVYLTSLSFVGDRLLKVSDYFFAMALLAVVSPMTSLYGLDVDRPLFPVLVVVFSIYLISLVVRVQFVSFKRLPTVKYGQKLVVGISLIFVSFLVAWYFISGVTVSLDFSKVYDVRAENAELAAGGLLAYTNNWTYQIFNIFLMALALFYRKYFLFLLFFLAQVYFFAASGHKTILFLPLLLVGTWFYFRKTSSLLVLPLVFSGVIVFTLFSYFVLGDLWLSSLFSRRLFYVPANLTFVYFEFFSDHPKIFWSNSVLSNFLTYPYDLSLTHVIGRYLGKEGMGANNGFIASGYAHAGFLGVFIYALIVGLILRFVNDITYKTLPIWLSVALSVVPLRALLINSDLFTVMLTHGFIVAIILIYLVRFKRA